jgi:uncharacterized LabA/DUF88 family protein
MKRSIFFIDGFNLYHSLDNKPQFHKYKWLNLWKLALQFSHHPYEDLQQVKYFTAYAKWKPASVLRHKAYIKALQSVGVDVVFGRFQEKQLICRAESGCGKKYISHEEKLTDVNIAISIVESCVTKQCDILYLISGDNDLVPALDAAKRISPSLDITVILPINAKANTLTRLCHDNNYSIVKISEAFLANSQFPQQITICNKVYSCPLTWR